ncbi:branched-chain amino acid ABC transporter permease [Bacillus sp. M6-12]|uniref:branched-chain amino acid ABC transporter permease n=1 Tax=Bacillus sp. M6-12 TaxID=2054166 RepID=UPI000C75E396|nr:branched-chain amino acid ABC transporter permease [Bacillus sp. M6-12]PLS17054.1 branched-chain amino acid ABC transporter permease [Bacillus sp. M6-12]
MSKNLLSIVALIVGIGMAPFLLSDYGVSLATEILIMSIFAVSLGMIMGYAGMVSFGHAAFFGIGAYTVALLGEKIPSVYALILLSILITAVVALISGAVFIRTSNFSFLMITLAFGQLLFALAWKMEHWTGGADGIKVSAYLDFGFGEIYSPLGLYYTMAIAFILVYLLLRAFVNSPAGKITKGIMENESRMKALGYNVRIYKLIAYCFSGAIAGFGGSLYAYFNLFVSPDLTHWTLSGQVMLMVIIGGVGTLLGPFIGAGVFIVLQNFISTYTERWPLIMGILLVALVLIGKGGVIHWFGLAGKHLKKREKPELEAATQPLKKEVAK